MRFAFHTDHHPASRRFDSYLDVLGDVLKLPLDVRQCSCISGRPFYGQVSTHRVADVELSRISSAAHVSAGLGGATAGGDFLQFDLQVRGTGCLRQDGREVRLAAGDLSVFETSKPFRWQFDAEFQTFVINVPKDMLPEFSAAAGPYVASVIRGHSPLGRLVRDFVAQLVPVVDQVDTATGERLVRAMLELLQGAVRSLGSQGEPLSAEGGAPALAVARRYIEDNFQDGALDVGSVARHARVSAAHLQRLFRATGESVGDCIWQQRLQHARALLESPALADWSLARVAMEAGFGNLAHFSRRFKSAFGASPSAYRAGCARSATAIPRAAAAARRATRP